MEDMNKEKLDRLLGLISIISYRKGLFFGSVLGVLISCAFYYFVIR